MPPTPPDQSSIRQKFTDALDALVEQVKTDRSILAALLCGSLSHDTVWSKSDIDLVLVTVDDRKVEEGDLSVNADGVTVHAMLVPRTAFRKMVDGSVRSSFAHSFLTKAACSTRTTPRSRTSVPRWPGWAGAISRSSC